MKTIHPWINFNGNAEEAFTFYQSVFGGNFTKIVRFGELSNDAFQIPQSEINKIWY
jgi:PhnB protein